MYGALRATHLYAHADLLSSKIGGSHQMQRWRALIREKFSPNSSHMDFAAREFHMLCAAPAAQGTIEKGEETKNERSLRTERI